MANVFPDSGSVLEKVELQPGLTKEIVRRGEASGASPTVGAEVRCHYTGKLLTGEQFDSSRSRGKPFVFKIGVGMVIRGWDVGIASMLPGERAILTCSPDFGYGAAGAGGVIPPNATLAFDVELLAPGAGGGSSSWCTIA
ncbi:hypothetical protein KFE25_004901 [Diacronema lutheri]|uniref:peptidylprolyl isomerase n=2 Tax=Diacronema lutheri TaxID=2081491 RepID=A0A8J5XQ36_DIALT|nr:hypothetical protein KFE25_004901 [Diacronema lutheri]